MISKAIESSICSLPTTQLQIEITDEFPRNHGIKIGFVFSLLEFLTNKYATFDLEPLLLCIRFASFQYQNTKEQTIADGVGKMKHQLETPNSLITLHCEKQ